MKKLINTALALFLATTMCSQHAATVWGEVLVQLKKEVKPQQIEDEVMLRAGLLAQFNHIHCVSETMRIHLFSFDENEVSKPEMLRLLRNTQGVAIAQANHVVAERLVPNDPFFGQQWHHQQSEDHDIDTDLAWDVTTGGYTATGDQIVVCNIEPNGINWSQVDIAPNHWVNEDEIPGNGIDDDGNGYIDDFDGWNSIGDNDNISPGNHGTQTSSMIGAKGNNSTGITGVNWDVKIMYVQMGGVNESNAIAAYEYPLKMRQLYNETNGVLGAFVVATNSSWGTDNGQPEDAPLWCAMYDAMGAVGILSCASTANNNVNIDVVGDLPTACPSEYLIAVTASDNNDVRDFSGYGQTTIDLAAPGDQVYLANNTSYGNATGTSFASPCVAGAVALAYSTPCTSLMEIAMADPPTGAAIVRNAIFDGVDEVANLNGECVTGGRLNVNNAINLLLSNCETGTCIAPFAVDITQIPGTTSYIISWSSTASAENFQMRYRVLGNSVWIEINGIESQEATLENLAACSTYELQLMSTCSGGQSQWSNSITFETDGCCVNPSYYIIESITANAATIEWEGILAADGYTVTFGPEGGPFENISNVVTTTYTFANLQPCTHYVLSVFSNCVGPEPVPSHFEFNTPGCSDCEDLEYCTVTGDADLEYIANVTLGDINRTSGSDDGYILVEDQTTTLLANEQYTIYCTPGYTGFVYNEYFKAWIDFNSNGDFEEPAELIFDAGTGTTDQVSGTFTVPLNVQEGKVRLRVGMSYYGLFGSGDLPVICGANEYGETEDYCITLDDDISVDEHQTSHFSVFPNPFIQSFYAHTAMQPLGLPVQVEIFNALGQRVCSHTSKNGEAINAESLAPGVYVVNLRCENTTSTLMLIKH